MKFYITFFVLICVVASAIAQQRELNNAYRFQDGIYLSHVDFAKDSPSMKIENFNIKEMEGSEYNFKIFQFIFNDDSLSFKKQIWGLCIEGVPYINEEYDSDFVEPEFLTRKKFVLGFSRIQTIGSICLYAAAFAQRDVSPAAGVALGASAIFINNGKYSSGNNFQLKILNLRTGSTRTFTDKNLIEFISHDSELASQISSAKKPKEQMFITLKKYNERYPFLID